MRGIPQNVAHFLLHAPAVAAGAALQPGLHALFEVADYELRHLFLPLLNDIMISLSGTSRKTCLLETSVLQFYPATVHSVLSASVVQARTRFHQLLDWSDYHQQQVRLARLGLGDHCKLLDLPRIRRGLAFVEIIKRLQTGCAHGR